MKTLKDWGVLILFLGFLAFIFWAMSAEAQEFTFGTESCKIEVEIKEGSLFYPFCKEQLLSEGPKNNRTWMLLPPGCLMVVATEDEVKPYQDEECWIVFKNRIIDKKDAT